VTGKILFCGGEKGLARNVHRPRGSLGRQLGPRGGKHGSQAKTEKKRDVQRYREKAQFLNKEGEGGYTP